MTNPIAGQQLPPEALKTQQAMLKLLSTPPESIIALLDRLQIPWARVEFKEEISVVIRWKDLMEGERRNQAEGPFMKKLVEEMKKEAGK